MERNQQRFDGKLREIVKGGGLATSYVHHSNTCIIDESSRAEGYARVQNYAQLLNGTIVKDFAKVFDNAIVRNSRMSEFSRVSGNAEIDSSLLSGTSEIYGSAKILSSSIENNAVVSGEAVVTNCILGANVIIDEYANVFGLSTSNLTMADTLTIMGDAVIDFSPVDFIDPGARIITGVWRRPPKVVATDYFTCTEGVNDRMLIGCLCHSINVWLSDTGYKTCIGYGFNDDMYKQFREAVLEIQAYKKQHPSPKLRRKSPRIPDYEIEAAQDSDRQRL